MKLWVQVMGTSYGYKEKRGDNNVGVKCRKVSMLNVRRNGVACLNDLIQCLNLNVWLMFDRGWICMQLVEVQDEIRIMLRYCYLPSVLVLTTNVQVTKQADSEYYPT